MNTYDALGRRIEKIEYASPANITTRYYYDGWRVLAETDAADTTQREYVYGNYLDETLIFTDSGDNDYYYVHDHLFSPVALLDEDGVVLERYEYDVYGPFGKKLEAETIFDNNPILRSILRQHVHNYLGHAGGRSRLHDRLYQLPQILTHLAPPLFICQQS